MQCATINTINDFNIRYRDAAKSDRTRMRNKYALLSKCVAFNCARRARKLFRINYVLICPRIFGAGVFLCFVAIALAGQVVSRLFLILVRHGESHFLQGNKEKKCPKEF